MKNKTTEKEAKELASGLDLTTIRDRCFYEDCWSETVIDWKEIAKLIDRIKNKENK